MDDSPDRPTFHGPRDYLELARSPAATPHQLRQLARSQYNFVVQAVAENPNTPAELLVELVPERGSVGEASMLLVLATNPRSDASILREIAGRVPPSCFHDRSPEGAFRLAIALFENPNTPLDVLLSYLSDPDTTTEFRKVAARQAVHEAVLEQLRTDRSEKVRRAVERRLGAQIESGPNAHDVQIVETDWGAARWMCSCGQSSGGRWSSSPEEALKAAQRHLARHGQ